MAQISRRDAREEAFKLLFETEFHPKDNREEIYALACEDREFVDDSYIRTVYFGVCEHTEEIDEMITKHSNGWKVSRIAPVSRCVLRLCIFEMMFMKDIPTSVSINEAVELVKKFDEEKMRAFVNGILNGAKDELEGNKEG